MGVLSLILILSAPFSIFGQGKALAVVNEEEENIVNAFKDLEFVYNQEGEFLGIYEEDVEILRGTEYEYVLDDLDDRGLLLSENDGISLANVQDEVRQEAITAFENDPAYREAFTTCLSENLVPGIGQTFAQQVISGQYNRAISTLADLGLRVTPVGLMGTYLECAVSAQLET